MNIEELKAARNQLENDLKKEIDKRVSEFVGKTGIQIDRVMVDMVILDIVGLQPSTVLNGVRVGWFYENNLKISCNSENIGV